MPLFFLHGESDYRLEERARFLLEGFRRKYDSAGINATVINALTDSWSANRVMEEVLSAPFLAEKRLIMLKAVPSAAAASEDGNEEEKRLAESLETVPESTILIFVGYRPDKRKTLYKKLLTTAEVEEFNDWTAPSIKKWIKNKIALEDDTIDYLIEVVGNDLYRLDSEIAKLATYGGVITPKEINLLVSPTLSNSVFDFTDAISQKDHRKALRLFAALRQQGESIFAIFPMIIRNFRILLLYKNKLQAGQDRRTIMSDLKIPPFVASKVHSQADNYSLDVLQQCYKSLLEIDVQVKTGVINTSSTNTREFDLAIEKFILDFGVRR